MCLIAWRWSPDSDTPLVWAANRDEFAHRPSAALQTWSTKTHTILSGLDLALEPLQGLNGTWSGVNEQGKFAWLTNIRAPQHANPEAPSRGHLVSQYLSDDTRAADYLTQVHRKAHRYNGFNLVVGHIGNAEYSAVCQHYNSATGVITALKPGVYGLSNADLDSPWPKTRALVQALSLHTAAQLSTPNAHFNSSALFDALSSTQRYSGDTLPNTGVAIEIEHVLSSAFIATTLRGNAYGTRSSTVGWAQNEQVTVHERSFDSAGVCNNTVSHTLDLSL